MSISYEGESVEICFYCKWRQSDGKCYLMPPVYCGQNAFDRPRVGAEDACSKWSKSIRYNTHEQIAEVARLLGGDWEEIHEDDMLLLKSASVEELKAMLNFGRLDKDDVESIRRLIAWKDNGTL